MDRKIAELIAPLVGVPAVLLEVYDMFAKFEDYETDVLYRARVSEPPVDLTAPRKEWFVLVDPEAATLSVIARVGAVLKIQPCDELETLRQAVLAEMPTRYDAGPH